MITNERLDANWRAITLELDAPAPPRVERLMRRVGVPSHITRLVVSTPGLRRAWFLALGLVSVIALTLTPSDDGGSTSPLLLLVVAPLMPVLGVALTYGPSADPAYEAHLATPMRGLRLLAVRAATTLAVSAVALTLLASTNEVSRPWAAAWLIPALALTTMSLAAMTWLSPRLATVAVSCTWVATVLVVRAIADSDLAAFSAPGQLAAVGVAMVGAAAAYFRRESFDRLALAA